MRPAWLFAIFVQHVISNVMPDPAVLLETVDELDGEVMTAAGSAQLSNYRESALLMKKVATLLRTISIFRHTANSKAQLVKEMLSPAVETVLHLKGRLSTEEKDLYRYSQKQIRQVTDQVEAARELLQTAHGNLAAMTSMNTVSSTKVAERKMARLQMVSVLIFPPSFATGVFGMNIGVPFLWVMGYPYLTPFYVIVG